MAEVVGLRSSDVDGQLVCDVGPIAVAHNRADRCGRTIAADVVRCISAGFQSGDAAHGDGAAALEVLEPLIAERDGRFARLVTSDGGADLYGIDGPSSGLMMNHASGDAIWQLVVEVAVAAGCFIVPVGCPVAVVAGTDQAQLPPELRSDAVAVESGTDLKRLIGSC